MLKTDSHFHLKKWNDGSVEGCADFIEKTELYRQQAGFEYVTAACLPSLDGCDVSVNIMAAILKLENPRVFAYGGLMYPKFPVKKPMADDFSPEQQLSDLMAVGFDGVKMLEGKPNIRRKTGIPLSDELYDLFYRKAEKEKIPVLMHIADPSYFWHKEKMPPEYIEWGRCYDDDLTFISFEQHLEEVKCFLDKHTNISVIFAHMLFLSEEPERLTRLLDTYPNICVDVTPGTEELQNMSKSAELWRGILTEFSDRVLMGTDNYVSSNIKDAKDLADSVFRFLSTNDEVSIWGFPMKGIGLSEEVVSKIAYENFHRLAGTRPKRINRDALIKYIRKYMPYIAEGENKKGILEKIERLGFEI